MERIKISELQAYCRERIAVLGSGISRDPSPQTLEFLLGQIFALERLQESLADLANVNNLADSKKLAPGTLDPRD